MEKIRTKVKEEVLKEMLPYFSIQYGNASSIYKLGRESRYAAATPARALIALFRPMLIKIFGLEKLKAIKKQIEGKNRYE